MNKVLWISRHIMTNEQYKDLVRIWGDIEVLQCDKTVTEIKEIESDVESADIIAAVLPCDLLCDLLEISSGKPVIRSVSQRVPTGKKIPLPDGKEESEYKFVHKYWQQLVEGKVTFKILS